MNKAKYASKDGYIFIPEINHNHRIIQLLHVGGTGSQYGMLFAVTVEGKTFKTKVWAGGEINDAGWELL